MELYREEALKMFDNEPPDGQRQFFIDLYTDAFNTMQLEITKLSEEDFSELYRELNTSKIENTYSIWFSFWRTRNFPLSSPTYFSCFQTFTQRFREKE